MHPARQPETITDPLRKAILSGVYPPGERLREVPLSQRFNVGRAAVRAAIVELAKEGLVSREPNRGASVRLISLSEAVKLIESRAQLESLIARYATLRSSADEKAALHRTLKRMLE